ncbi:MAG: WYL domain-containing protein [Clostridia bacterium]|nr:WYL domain-containing protein [Clostridia bacterium]
MIFNEIYGAYYNAVAEIIKESLRGPLDNASLRKIIERHAFKESAIELIPQIKNEEWKLIKRDGTTPLKNAPTLPLTTLQKRWLRAVMLDPRIKLFIDTPHKILPEVEPLFLPEDIVLYDKFEDGDNFTDKDYIHNFRTILSAILENKCLRVKMAKKDGRLSKILIKPVRLEYSEKDDKFRLIAEGCSFAKTINLASIISCEKTEENVQRENPKAPTESLVLEVKDQRNALERVMLHLAHFKKTATLESGDIFQVTIEYSMADEAELLIRILSFGHLVRVISPLSFKDLVKERIDKQIKLLNLE